ncbi:unnamed protein product [Paramecium octaurelia]|uniref:Uncharacterized protein n=1 Tax=Paramecium octaurelia TaxID=43137 RepID=A0A8S1T0I0_PAROT|nr:unnamed protein product [Paramecium octaurelia]
MKMNNRKYNRIKMNKYNWIIMNSNNNKIRMKKNYKVIMITNNRRTMKNEKQHINEKLQQNNIEKQQQDNNEKQIQVTKIDVDNLDKINYFEIARTVWNKMEEQSIALQFITSQELNDPAQSEQNLTSYDFYDEFINQYHYQQIEKQRNLGKQIYRNRFLHDLQKYSINLAKVMSTKQMTQIQYQQQGFLYQEEKEEEKWQNEFFNDDDRQFGSNKKDLRSVHLSNKRQELFICPQVYLRVLYND